MRNARHEVLGEAKRLVQSKEATQDDVKSLEQELAKMLERYQAQLDVLEAAKTKELMAV
jgi:ribosome recycling factor